MAGKYKPGTLPDHDWCTIHKTYMLGCAQFEQLIARSGQRCEICGAAGGSGRNAGKLHIDHDHRAHRWAVRGLLCERCNRKLTNEVAESRPPWAVNYLDNAWWLGECERAGVPATIAPEPDCGSLIVDQYDVPWLREGDGLWRPHWPGRPGISSADWQWLYRCRGPHNIAPLNPYALSDDRRTPAWECLIRAAEGAALRALVAEHGEIDLGRPALRGYGPLLSASDTPRR